MLSPQALKREARIVAAKLYRQKAWLEQRNRSSLDQTQWVLVSAKTRRKSKSIRFETGVIEAMRRQEWLKRDPAGTLSLTRLGHEALIGQCAGGDFASQHQHRETRIIKDEGGNTKTVLSNETESPLGWMRARKDKSGKPLLSPEQFEAGERLRRDFTLACLSARVTSSWDFTGVTGDRTGNRADGHMEITEKAMAAKQRLFAALDFLGPEMSGAVFEICCLASGLEAAERQFNWPRRSAKLVLQIALAKLSEHYGLVQPDVKTTRPANIQHWGRQGYRPHIPPAQ